MTFAVLVLRRFAAGALLLLAVSALTFLFAELAPGDFFDELRLDPRIGAETLAAERARWGLDEPLPRRYARWLGAALTGDLGFSFAQGRPVAPLVARRALNTLALALPALVLAWGLALPLGIAAAARPGGLADRALALLSSLLLALPELVLALLALLLAVRSGLFPAGGMRSLATEPVGIWVNLGDFLWHLALPALVLAAASLPPLVRHVRSAMAEAVAAPFVTAARGHGIPHRRRLWFWALPAAANPLVSLLGTSLGFLLSGSLMVEVVFSWPGLGPLLVDAILARDLYVVLGGLLLGTVFLIAGQLVADLGLHLLDPRLREAPR